MISETWEPSPLSFLGGLLVLAAAALLLVGQLAWAGIVVIGVALAFLVERRAG